MTELKFLEQYLPKYICSAIFNLHKPNITEIRVRKNRPLIIVSESMCEFLYSGDSLIIVDKTTFDEIFLKICDYSVYSNEDSLKRGYVTLKNGSRVGVCSTAVYSNNSISGIRDISSLNIRIPREIKGFSLDAVNSLFSNSVSSTIIAGRPSTGKTTLLRDIARELSNKMYKVTVIDSRNELAAKCNDGFLLDVGQNTDVITGFNKEQAIDIAIRTLSPDIIVCDEIGSYNELSAISNGFCSGVCFIISFHCLSLQDLINKPLIKAAFDTDEFQNVIIMEDNFNYSIYSTYEVMNEAFRRNNDNLLFGSDWDYAIPRHLQKN